MKRITILLLSCTALLAACNPAEIPGEIYDGPDFVYFETASFQGVSRFGKSTPESVFTNTVLVVGDYYDKKDRTYKIEVVLGKNGENGEDNVNYDISKLCEIDKDVITIHGGEITSECKFKVLNKPEYLKQFKGKNIKIELRMVATDDFSLGFQKQSREYEIQVSANYKEEE